MSGGSSQELTAVVNAALQRIDHKLRSIASVSRVNAALLAVDPDYVLPTPAVALMGIETQECLQPENTMIFRSVEPLGPDGDAFFNIVDPSFVAHPWQVERAAWVTQTAGDERSSGRRPLTRGIVVSLTRPPASRSRAGWLNLFVSGDTLLQWGLENAHVHVGTLGLRSRRASAFPQDNGDMSVSGGTYLRMEVMSRELLAVELPSEVASRHEIELGIDFEEPIPGAAASEPDVRSNVALVWNSRDARYPSPDDVEQIVAESRRRLVHPLDARYLGAGWKAWTVRRVGAANDSRITFVRGAPDSRPARAGRNMYHLSFVPSDGGTSAGTDAMPVLSVLITPEGRETLDRSERRLGAEYCVTSGSAANGIPDGSEFQLIDTTGLPTGGRVVGTLIGESWGGTDGLTAYLTGDAPLDYLHALLPSGRVRTVGDVLNVLQAQFGNELSLVDTRDLLRTARGSRVEPLHVRMSFRHPDRNPRERRIILAACQSFLNRYLAGSHTGEVLLIDSENGAHDAD